MKKSIILLMALTMCFAVNAQEIEKIDKFASGYINGTYMNKYKTIDGVLFHLTHPRDMNGKHNSEGQRKITTQEKDKICFSSAEEIRHHLNLKN